MRSTIGKPVSFVARVNKEEKNLLDNLLPMQGGRKWAIETALDTFLSACEKDNALVASVREKIINFRAEEAPFNAEDLGTKVQWELYTRFNDLFPEKGATVWFLRTFLSDYVTALDTHTLPEDVVKTAVRKMLGMSNE